LSDASEFAPLGSHEPRLLLEFALGGESRWFPLHVAHSCRNLPAPLSNRSSELAHEHHVAIRQIGIRGDDRNCPWCREKGSRERLAPLSLKVIGDERPDTPLVNDATFQETKDLVGHEATL
jgi:hypothetical protein